MIHKLVDLKKAIPDIIFDIRYATPNNFLRRAVYDRHACYVHKDVLEKLKSVQQELKTKNLCLKVFDGYRPASASQAFWDAIKDDRYVANPAVRRDRHSRATAIDITIVNVAGDELEMPTEFDDFTEKAHPNAENITETAKANRLMLTTLMKKHGFTQHPNEWWHFDLAEWESYPPLDLTFDQLEQAIAHA